MAWTADNLDDQSGKVFLVTGANSGLGLDTSLGLAEKGAHVIMAVRSMDRGAVARDQILAQVPNASLELRQLDLTDLDSVAAFSDALHADNVKLDGLINNAGIMVPPYETTKQGFESQIGVNHLAHFALTLQLLDLLKTNTLHGARVVNVSSEAHRSGAIDVASFQSGEGYSGMKAYAQSKIANLYFTNELARKLAASGSDIVATSAHPGFSATNLSRSIHNTLIKAIVDFGMKFFAQSSEMGALPTLRAACDADVKPGEFYGPRGFMGLKGPPDLVTPHPRAMDTDVAAHLWTVSEELTGTKWPLTRS